MWSAIKLGGAFKTGQTFMIAVLAKIINLFTTNVPIIKKSHLIDLESKSTGWFLNSGKIGAGCFHIKLHRICLIGFLIQQYSEFFWSLFSRIRIEYGEIRSISLYSVRLRKNA